MKIAFFTETFLPKVDGIVTRPLDPRDVPAGRLYLCQLRGRTLPVAAAATLFAVQLAEFFGEMGLFYEQPTRSAWVREWTAALLAL